MIRRFLTLATLAGLAPTRTAQVSPPFVAHEIASGLRGGYQVVAADLNRDGKLDLVAVASGMPDLVWFENPMWTRHVIASGFAGLINVAVADLDGDGIPEIAVAHGFSTDPGQSPGIVSLLTHSANVTDLWTAREIDRAPASHRLRWFSAPGGAKWLINAPLAGATSRAPNYDGPTPVYFYRAPTWRREVVTENEDGVVHAIEPMQIDNRTGTRLYSAGFAGVHEYAYESGAWSRKMIALGDPTPRPKGGASDVAIGHVAREPFFATIEPWHGNEVAVYRGGREGWERSVIDTTVVDGHTLVVRDLDGDGRDEIIVGQRGGTRGVWIYSTDSRGAKWTRSTLDEGGMAAAGCTAADLNGDGRVDIACIGTATANLKWYENMGLRPRD